MSGIGGARPGTASPRELLANPIIAVLRADDATRYERVAATLVEEGIEFVELTLTTPGTIAVLPQLRRALPPSARLGVGTVLTWQQADEAMNAGADYIVTPSIDSAVINYVVSREVPIYPGGLTPTELQHAWNRGASAVKLFPASAVGPDYIKQLHGPFPDMRIVPSGGISLDTAGAWIAAGAEAVSVGGPLVGDSLRGGDLGELRERARRLRASVDEAIAAR